MELILTSFGLSHLNRDVDSVGDMFYRMPPISLSHMGNSFMPDYAVLLLCNRVILDTATFNILLKDRHWAYGEMSEVMARLHDEGFVRLEDFSAIVSDNLGLLDTMLSKDLKILDEWVDALKDSLNSWREFLESARGPLFEEMIRHEPPQHASDLAPGHFQRAVAAEYAHAYTHIYAHDVREMLHHAAQGIMSSQILVEEALRSATKRRKSEYRSALRDTLAGYLSQVNANLVLCETLQAGFHDWYDFRPFYHEKFIRVGKENAPEQDRVDNVKRLFDLSFPEYTFWTPKGLLKALKDKRITDLRELVDKATRGEVEFDREFATRILQEVLGVESGLGKFRNFVSYATSPLGFIPVLGTPIQKAAEESTVRPVENAKRKKHRWFYLISELSAKYRRKTTSIDETG